MRRGTTVGSGAGSPPPNSEGVQAAVIADE
jgi:hypothetical protein